MISRSDWEPLPTPTLSPFCTRVPFSVSVFTAAVWCVPALRVPLVHSLINHFRQKRAGVNRRPVRGIYKETTAAGPFARSHRTGGKNSRQVTQDLPAPCFRALQAEGVCRPEGLCPDLTFS